MPVAVSQIRLASHLKSKVISSAPGCARIPVITRNTRQPVCRCPDSSQCSSCNQSKLLRL
eukprot:6173676-Pleurochrysis_carterae.AAC.1